MANNFPLTPFPSTPSRKTPHPSYTPTTNSPFIETRATTYEELVQSLDVQVDSLQYLPSEAKDDKLFDKIHERPSLKSSSRCSSTPKLAFGTYREDSVYITQVYVYLRSPSFKNTEPSTVFGKRMANTKYTVMNTKDINCADGMLQANKFWRPFIKDGKFELDAVKAVLKALFIRKGITLSAPIPVVGSVFRSNLVLGCEMFRVSKQNRRILEKTPKQVDKSANAIDVSKAQSSSPAMSSTSSTIFPVVPTAQMYSQNELSCHVDASRPLVVDSSKKRHSSRLTITEQDTVKVEANKSVTTSKLAAVDDPNSDALLFPGNQLEEVGEEPPFIPEDDPEELSEEPEESSVSKTNTPEPSKGMKTILESLSASYNDREDLQKKINEMTAQVTRHITTLEELHREKEQFDAEYERKRRAFEERISVEDQDKVSKIAEIETKSQTMREKLEAEKHQLGVMTPEMMAVWELSRKFVCKEYGIKEGLPSKRQKTSH